MQTTSETNASQHRFVPSVDTQAIAKRLEKAEPGEVVTYDELSDIIKHNVQNGHRHILYSAMNLLQREKRMVFGVVTKVGLQRMPDADIATSWKHDLDIIRRRTTRSSRRVSCADFDNLTHIQKREAFTGLSVMGALRMFTKKDAVKKIEGAVDKEPKRMDYRESLQLFQK